MPECYEGTCVGGPMHGVLLMSLRPQHAFMRATSDIRVRAYGEWPDDTVHYELIQYSHVENEFGGYWLHV